MRFEWDEAKRLSNIGKHDIDFRDAVEVFDGRRRLDIESQRPGEHRTLSVAFLLDRFVTVTWTLRDDDLIRIISVRRARHAKERQYRHIHG